MEGPCPDGVDRLVQFSGLTQGTAIQKGAGAFSLFKRRVYRGAWLEHRRQPVLEATADMSTETHSDVTLDVKTSLAIPAERLQKSNIARQLENLPSGKIDHLCLVVHGIGEMMRSMDLFGLSFPNLSAVCGSMRTNHTEVQQAHFARMYPTADLDDVADTGRVEYLPVEWHESFAILTQSRRAPRHGEKRAVMVQTYRCLPFQTCDTLQTTL